MVRKKTTEISSEVKEIAKYDAEILEHAQKSYGDSWKKRGGVGAFMMLARKWDRLENQTKKFNYDIFETIYADPSPEGILDDIGDLRRYLFLVEAELRRELGGFALGTPQEPTEAKGKDSAPNPLGTLMEGNTDGTAETN
jgi:hypothetical protein